VIDVERLEFTMSELHEGSPLELRVVASAARGVRVDVCGEIDLGSVDVLRDVFDVAIADGVEVLEVDMSRVTFCDSTGLCALMRARRRSNAAGYRFRIVGASQPVRRLFELSGTGSIFALTSEAPSSVAGAAR
jgi:anti-sigma B factor antagonist